MCNQRGSDDASEFVAVERGFPFTFAATHWRDLHQTGHRDQTVGTVCVYFEIPVRLPTKQGAAILHKFIRYPKLFQLFCKLISLFQQFLMRCFKLTVFLLEAIALFPELDETFAQNNRTSPLDN